METYCPEVRRKRLLTANRDMVSNLHACREIAKELQTHLIGQLYSKGIIVEACPSSNLATGAVSDLARHPLFHCQEVVQGRQLESRGAIAKPMTTINTDDPGVFATRIDIEYALILEALDRRNVPRDVAFDLLWKMRDLGFSSAFPVA